MPGLGDLDAARLHCQALENHLAQHAEQDVVQADFAGLLSAMGLGQMQGAAIQEGAAQLAAADPAVQRDFLVAVQMGLELERLRRDNADRWPAVEWPQEWLPWLGYALWRTLCFLAATSLIDVVTAMGLPPFTGWLRAVLIALHACLAQGIWQLVSSHGTAGIWSIRSLGASFAIFAAFLVAYLFVYGRYDLPARATALETLQRGLPAAEAQKALLRQLQAQQQ